MVNKVQRLDEEINIMKQELLACQTESPSWAIERDTKLVNLEDSSRQNDLRFEGISSLTFLITTKMK